MGYFVGLDLGQASDFTALSVIEGIRSPAGTRYNVRHLKRYKLGTSYPDIAADVQKVMASGRLAAGAALICDATGVGRPVLDMLGVLGLSPIGVTITNGMAVTDDHSGQAYGVPKRDLVSNLQVLLQTGRLKFAQGLPEVQTLIGELMGFKVRVSQTGHDSYGNDWRESPHDDLVLSLSLAAWYAETHGHIQFWVGGRSFDDYSTPSPQVFGELIGSFTEGSDE